MPSAASTRRTYRDNAPRLAQNLIRLRPGPWVQNQDNGRRYLPCRCRAHKLSKCEKHSTLGVRFVSLSPRSKRCAMGLLGGKVRWRMVVARFVQYVMQQFGSK